MMTLVACVNRKGGSGKTTIAWNLANQWAQDGKRTLLVDTDPQGTFIQFFSRRENKENMGGEVISLTEFQPIMKRRQISGDHDIAIIDTPGTLREIGPVIRMANVLICPVQPTGADYLAFKETVTAIMREKGGSRIFVVPNRVKTAAQREELRTTVPAILAGHGRIATVDLGDWVKMQQETMAGLSVLDIAKKAAAERQAVAIIANEIMGASDGTI